MDIDDILKRKRFKSLDKYLTEEMHATAGELLVSKMIDVFESEARARDWFYSKLMPLNFKGHTTPARAEREMR